MAVASPPFTGFRPEAIQFLADLAANNDRAWFQPRKAEYERLLKEPLEAFVAAVGERLDARGVPILADPARSPFRIYRDVRFSKDKSPYKTNVGAGFPWIEDGPPAGRGRRVSGERGETSSQGRRAAGGYFHFQPGEMFIGGGMYHVEKPLIDAWRRAVVDRNEEVHEAIDDPDFLAFFGPVNGHEQLRRVPPGYPPDHPDAHLLRFKDVVFGRRLSDAEALSPGLPDLVAEGFEAAVPVFRFLARLSG
jgi:uncharacterized protein (TIGR02453 family)